MTIAAIQFRFSSQEPILQKWKPLHEGLSKRWKKRNEIAHGTVVKWQFPDPKTKNPTTETFFVPSLYKQVNTLSATLLEWSKDQSTRSIFVPKHVSIETRSKIAAKASTSSMIG